MRLFTNILIPEIERILNYSEREGATHGTLSSRCICMARDEVGQIVRNNLSTTLPNPDEHARPKPRTLPEGETRRLQGGIDRIERLPLQKAWNTGIVQFEISSATPSKDSIGYCFTLDSFFSSPSRKG
jgi:hypothetical protein